MPDMNINQRINILIVIPLSQRNKTIRGTSPRGVAGHKMSYATHGGDVVSIVPPHAGSISPPSEPSEGAMQILQNLNRVSERPKVAQ